MALAEVIDYATARRRHIARRLQTLGCPTAEIVATTSDAELDTLWAREKVIAELRRLTGHGRHGFAILDTGTLIETKAAVLRQLMGCTRGGDNRLIYTFTTLQPKTRRSVRDQKLRAWGLVAS